MLLGDEFRIPFSIYGSLGHDIWDGSGQPALMWKNLTALRYVRTVVSEDVCDMYAANVHWLYGVTGSG